MLLLWGSREIGLETGPWMWELGARQGEVS